MKQVAAIALMCDHHILMGRRRDSGKWTNPGGHLNPGEDPLKGAVREVKEETGIDIDPRRLEHVETRIVKKPDGTEIKVYGYKVHLLKKPATTMGTDPDQEVVRWRWLNLDGELSHISHELHVPLGDNVLLDHIIKAKPQRRHFQHIWTHARRIGMGKRAEELVVGGRADGIPDSRFPQDQLRMGRKVEREHTANPRVADEIARDHLSEDPKYYSHLKEMEDKYVEKKAFWNGFEKRALLGNIGSNFLRVVNGEKDKKKHRLVKRALQESQAKEVGSAMLSSLVPLGTAAHTVTGDRPSDHSKPVEWVLRTGGAFGGAAGALYLGRKHLGGKLSKAAPELVAAVKKVPKQGATFSQMKDVHKKVFGDVVLPVFLVGGAGNAIGEGAVHGLMTKKYYKDGRLIPPHPKQNS